MTLEQKIKSLLRDVPDFPKPGILFKDITPLLADPEIRQETVDALVDQVSSCKPEAIVAVEARGFIFGILLAQGLRVPFVPVRKSGKLPYKKVTESYELEYGSAEIEMHEDAIRPGMRVVIHDDLLATGGTASAAGRLVERLGGVVVGYSFLINLSFLPGEKKLQEEFSVRPSYLVGF
ncbi:adenine phosphoribosyltransferase [soil metagenome]